jgi:hypothetical protein
MERRVPAVLRNMRHALELSHRASRSYHRLFSLTQARQHGHYVVLDGPVGHLHLHAAHGGGVMVPLELAHRLVWLPSQIASPMEATASVATTSSGKRPGQSRLGRLGESLLTTRRAFDNSCGGFGLFLIEEVGLL